MKNLKMEDYGEGINYFLIVLYFNVIQKKIMVRFFLDHDSVIRKFIWENKLAKESSQSAINQYGTGSWWWEASSKPIDTKIKPK